MRLKRNDVNVHSNIYFCWYYFKTWEKLIKDDRCFLQGPYLHHSVLGKASGNWEQLLSHPLSPPLAQLQPVLLNHEDRLREILLQPPEVLHPDCTWSIDTITLQATTSNFSQASCFIISPPNYPQVTKQTFLKELGVQESWAFGFFFSLAEVSFITGLVILVVKWPQHFLDKTKWVKPSRHWEAASETFARSSARSGTVGREVGHTCLGSRTRHPSQHWNSARVLSCYCPLPVPFSPALFHLLHCFLT